MWEGWRWRWSRDLEVRMVAAAAASFKKVDATKLCQAFGGDDGLYDDGAEDDE